MKLGRENLESNLPCVEHPKPIVSFKTTTAVEAMVTEYIVFQIAALVGVSLESVLTWNSDKSLTIIKGVCMVGTPPSGQRTKGPMGEMLQRLSESAKKYWRK